MSTMKLNRITPGHKQQGMTLIETIIVVVILGIIAIVAVPQFISGISGGAKGQAFYDTASKLTQNWALLCQNAGQTTVVTGSVIPDTGKTALDVLIGGRANVAPAYQNAWDQAGLSALTGVAQGSAGSYTVSGFPITFGGGGSSTTPLTVTFGPADDAIVQQLVTKYGSKVSPLAASDTTNSVIQYGTASGGARTVTILKTP